MRFDYKENMPQTDWTSQIAFLKKHKVDNPEMLLKKYVVISKNVCCFKFGLEDEYEKYYKQIPFTKIKEQAVDRNRTVCFFIVMERSWWEFVESMHNGDLTKFIRSEK